MHKVLQQWPWLIVVIVVTAAAAFTAQLNAEPSSWLLRYLFAPGVIGYFLVGGIHGNASDTTRLVA